MNTDEILQKIKEMIDLANEDPSGYTKELALERVRRYPEVVEVIGMVYDRDIRFHVSSDTVKECEVAYLGEQIELLPLLKGLSSGSIPRGDCAKEWCATFIEDHPQYEDIFLKIIDKDLGCGIGISTVNKVFPGMIQDFKGNVPLAKVYEEGYVDFNKERWYASRKMDGIRCLCFIFSNGDVSFKSRNGKEFLTLSKIKEDLCDHWRGPVGIILDGELCSINDEGNESFSDIIKLYRRKDYTIPYPLFKVFDVYPIDEFNSGFSKRLFSEKISFLQEFLEPMVTIQLLPQTPVESKDHFLKLCADVPEEWEGLMLRKDAPTQFKRSKDLLKVKQFMDAEYKVISVQHGTKSIDGKDCSVCASIIIQHKGNAVGVGSGISDRDRLRWHNHPELIIGKTVTIKYFSESVDQNGVPSLRFPVLKHVWEHEKV